MNLDLSGLDELMGEVTLAEDAFALRVIELPLDLIEFDPEQPRGRIDEATLAGLAASMREHGVLQPISVRPNAQAVGRYIVNFGERRVRAARIAHLGRIPAFIEPRHDPYKQVIENLQREDLSPLSLAKFVARREALGESRAEIARRLGKPRSFITEIARLNEAPPEVKGLIESGRCTDVRTLYTLAKGCEENASDIAPLLEGEGPITRRMAQAASKQDAPGMPEASNGNGPVRNKKGSAGTLLVAMEGRTGELDWKQRPSPTSAVVLFQDGVQETIELKHLRLLRWTASDRGWKND